MNEKTGGYINRLVVTCLRSGLNRAFRVLQKPERAPIRAIRASSSGRLSSNPVSYLVFIMLLLKSTCARFVSLFSIYLCFLFEIESMYNKLEIIFLDKVNFYIGRLEYESDISHELILLCDIVLIASYIDINGCVRRK